MIFLDGAWSIITLPVGKSWDSGSASTMPFGRKYARKVLQKAPSSAILDAQTVKIDEMLREKRNVFMVAAMIRKSTGASKKYPL